MKLPEFFKKYKWYLIIGAIVGIILGIVFWLYNKNNPKVVETPIASINSPFVYQDEILTFSEYAGIVEIPSSLEVYKTTEPDYSMTENFVRRFSQVKTEISDDVYMWGFSDSIVTYSISNSLVFLTSSKGLVTDIKIGTKTDVRSFLLEYFGIKDTNITDVVELGNGKNEYKGYYKSDSLQYGSLYLDGYAVDIVSDNSKIYSLSILMLTPDYVSKYQQMPTSTLTTVMANAHETYTKYLSYDKNYEKQYPIIQASSKLKSVDIKKASYKYVFISHDNEYILPLYEVSGDGQLVDSQGSKYWASVLVYLCALDRAHLNKVEPFLKNNILLDQGN
jgi:hypothetical protein